MPPDLTASGFSPEAYLRARGLERRLYPDDVAAALPLVPPSHPLRDEWRKRADSAERLVAYLGRDRRDPREILDVGCGNGWLARRLAGIPGARVVGLDPNPVELAQAERLFVATNLRFVGGDVLAWTPVGAPVDVIVLASVIQYLPDLAVLLRRLLPWLAPAGEVHVLDSPLYADAELEAARERSRRHYASLGVPEMAAAYHHHPWGALDGFDRDVLYWPGRSPAARLAGRLPVRVARCLPGPARSPFPWVRIRATG